MANLEFCDKHNMVAYLKKPTRSEGFQEITATVRTVDNREQEITATVDGKEFTITEASGEGSGHPSKPQPPPSTAQPINEEPILNVVSSSHQKTQTPRVERATTTAASLDAEQASGNINRTQSTAIPNVPLPQGIGASGSPRYQEAMGGSIAQTRSERVPTSPLKKLEKTVKSNQARRRVKIVVSDDEANLEDSSKQGRMIEEIDEDAGVTLVTPTQGEDQPEDQLEVLSAAKVLADAAKTNVHTYTRRKRTVSTGSGGIYTASRLFSTAEESVSTADESMPVSTAGKGKGKMEESEDEQIKRTKLQQKQDRLGHEASVGLQDELNEEERQRMARVHKAAQSFTEEEWENIRARQLKRYSFDELKELFETTMKNVNTFVPIKTKDRGRASELAAGATIIDSAEVGSSKRAIEVELDHEGSKRQKTNEASRSVQEQP
ncbi:hypothetical protein Tco_1218098 [Tanacetum coccineum]